MINFKLSKVIETALSAISDELKFNSLPSQGPASRQQLLALKQRYENMLRCINNGELLAEEEFGSSIGHILADSWPYNHPLIEIILEAENGYQKQLNNPK